MIEEADIVGSEVTQLPTPAGLWLTCGPARPVEADDPALRAVPGDGRFTLLVGAPGEPTPTVYQIADAVRSLAPAHQERLVLTVYGAEPADQISLAQLLADALGTPVRAFHGLPLNEADGLGNRTAIDPAGRPSWQPFAQLSRYWPGSTGAVVESWQAPFPGAAPIGPGQYRLTDEWAVDLVPAGLVARPVDAATNPLLRCAPTHPDRVDLIVDGTGPQPLPDDMLTALGRFADALPFPARTRLRVVLTPGLPPASAQALRWAVPAPQESLAGGPEPVRPPARLATALGVSAQGRMMLIRSGSGNP